MESVWNSVSPTLVDRNTSASHDIVHQHMNSVSSYCRPREACVDFERVTEMDPTSATAYINLGLVAMQQLKNYRRFVIVLLCNLNTDNTDWCTTAWIVPMVLQTFLSLNITLNIFSLHSIAEFIFGNLCEASLTNFILCTLCLFKTLHII